MVKKLTNGFSKSMLEGEDPFLLRWISMFGGQLMMKGHQCGTYEQAPKVSPNMMLLRSTIDNVSRQATELICG
jgi:hypothetical protein